MKEVERKEKGEARHQARKEGMEERREKECKEAFILDTDDGKGEGKVRGKNKETRGKPAN
jgi:hypothetical protein